VTTANITYRMEVAADQHGVAAGAEAPGPSGRTAAICAGSYVHASRLLFPAMLDPSRDVHMVPAGTPLREMVQQLEAFQPDRLVGYASIVEELAAIALNGALHLPLSRIATNYCYQLPSPCCP